MDGRRTLSFNTHGGAPLESTGGSTVGEHSHLSQCCLSLVSRSTMNHLQERELFRETRGRTTLVLAWKMVEPNEMGASGTGLSEAVEVKEAPSICSRAEGDSKSTMGQRPSFQFLCSFRSLKTSALKEQTKPFWGFISEEGCTPRSGSQR